VIGDMGCTLAPATIDLQAGATLVGAPGGALGKAVPHLDEEPPRLSQVVDLQLV